MATLTTETLNALLAAREGPHLSLYQRTHRQHPENLQDVTRFGNLVKNLRSSVRSRVSAAEAELLLEPFEALAHDGNFWHHTLDGLAVLGARGIFHALRLPQRVVELVVVGDSFHTRPLRRFLQSVARYQVLGLSLGRIRLFEGNRHALDELEVVSGVPRTITEALGEELAEPHHAVASHGGVGASSNRMHHGQGGEKHEVDTDAERFFRTIDRAVLEHYSRPSGLPLILAAQSQHHHLFHVVSQNSLLVDKGIRVNPDAVSAEELRGRAWQIMEPRYQERLASLAVEFEQARAHGLGSDDAPQVAQAARSGRVATLLVEDDRLIGGRIDGATGQVELAAPAGSQSDDVLDDLGELVAKMGGRVLALPAARMPTRTGLAATYRY